MGHEIDWAISDYVADLRAPTPSAAAELVCQSSLDQIEKVNQLRSSMYDALIGRLNTIKLRIAAFSPAAARAQLESRLNRVRMTLDSDTVSLSHRMENLISARKSKAELLRHKIMALSPLSVLERGYSITSDSQGRTIRSASQVSCGDTLTLTLKDGKITTTAQEVTHG